MNQEGNKSTTPTSRFAKGVPHYHRSNRAENSEWDDWTGDPAKSSMRQKFEYMFHSFATVVVGCVILVLVLSALFFFWRKILPMIGN